MNILQFLRILAAHRLLIGVSTIVCAIAGLLVAELVPPRYEATSRVMLDVIKPDPVTGQVMATAFLRAYTKTQIELVQDQQVARRVVDMLGLDKDKALQRAYQNRHAADVDFNHWAAEVVMKGAGAQLIEGSNILEISYTSQSPTRAKQVADGLRQAYMDLTLQSRREAARRNAAWYEAQADKSKAILLQAEAKKAEFERQTGIVLQDNKVDVDSARLSALAMQGGAPVVSGAVPEPASAGQLAQLDSDIAEASKTLGPNHPGLIQMKRRREVLAQQVARDRAASGSAASAAVSAARATSGLLEQQKGKVMAQREQVEKARLMQDEVDLRREQYGKAISRAAELRQEAEVADSGVVPLGNAITPQSPVFPKKALVIGVATAGGLGLGLLAALLIELFGRRVRSADDLKALVDAPVLAVIRNTRQKKARRGLLSTMGVRRPRLARA